MSKIIISPAKYVQGENEILNIAKYVSQFGKKAILVASDDDYNRINDKIEKSLSNSDCKILSVGFNGECSKKEIERIQEVLRDGDFQVVIGLGGGKSLDTAKAVAHFEKLPVIIVPTIASTDAPCSSLAVIYTEEGEFDEYCFFTQNPNVVLVDTDVIAKAPVRFLVAGMGDALSTYFEARSCERSFAENIPGGMSTKAAIKMAELCYETLLEDSYKAKIACENNVVTPALENIVEANILLSGLGFESSGLAAAHAIHNGLTVLEETHGMYHGEKVAFGVITHLILENADMEEIETVIDYCKILGLPTTLHELGVEEVTYEKVQKVAEASCAEGETIHNMPFSVKVENVIAAILTANSLGKEK